MHGGEPLSLPLSLGSLPPHQGRRQAAHSPGDHGGYLPAFVAISPAQEHEVKKARSLSLPKGLDYLGRLELHRLCLVCPTHHSEAQRLL